MAKTEIYTWRCDRANKRALEDEARRRSMSVATVLDEIVEDWRQGREELTYEEEQRRLHEAVRPHIGTISGDDPMRATEARERIRARLQQKRAQGRA